MDENDGMLYFLEAGEGVDSPEELTETIYEEENELDIEILSQAD
jgi:hypothetical protein